MPRVLVVGGAGFRNAGDEALLRSGVERCLEAGPEFEVVVAANNTAVARETLAGLPVQFVPSPRRALFCADQHYAMADDVFFERCRRLRRALGGTAPERAIANLATCSELDFVERDAASQFLRCLLESDAVVVHGGGFLTSYTRSRLHEHAFTVGLASSWGKRVLLRSQQLGPFVDDRDRACIAGILAAADYVSTRDLDQSAREVAALSARDTSPVDQVDDAFVLSADRRSEADIVASHRLPEGRYVCVAYRDNRQVGVEDACLRHTARVTACVHREFDLPVVLLPQGPFDEAGLERLAGYCDFPVRLVRPVNHLRECMAIASAATVAVALPHHSLMFALRGGVPIFSPVMGPYYLFKNRGSMRFFGLEDHVWDVGGWPEAIPGEVVEMVRSVRHGYQWLRRRLLARGAELLDQAREQDVAFRAILRAARSESPSHRA